MALSKGIPETQISEVKGGDPYQLKRDQLIRHLSVVLIIGAALYLVLDRAYFQKSVPIYIFAIAIVTGMVAFMLNKLGKRDLSKIIGLLLFNLLMYCLVSSESRSTSLFLFFGVAGLAALALFGYEERLKAYGFAFLSLALSLFSQLVDYSPFPQRHFSEDQVLVFNIINTVTASYCAIYVIMLLLRINHRAEAQLRSSIVESESRNKMLVKSNAELDQFMYSTSHDLRAPLSSLKGLIHLSELGKDLSEVREYIHLMKGSIHSLEKFTLDITDHYKNSRTDSLPAVVRLRTKVDDVIKNLSFLDNTKRIRFENEVPDQTQILTDPARLRIVLNNVISNSIKYSDPDKSDPSIKVTYAMQGDRYLIHIKDNGIGIEEDRLDKIFDMFYRASDRSQGSGLGLYIVKETIEKLNGEISVNSALGEGTTFTIKLPFEAASAV